jgi:DNA-binding NarL/FixJ family response regulator
MDVQLPGMDGFAVTEQLLASNRDLPVVLISTRDRADYGRLIAESGARGFVSKDELSGASLRELLE